ncbi:disease resistance protein RGA2-like [Benincasa hispida]|uniref:disease resistance protein RGA2-like n=1 Tax=Benincasa hispida TaxID=102211 RepID=UPI001901B1B1|nr:disease resistance protein RGA2-like [Benincasa hispida]
MAELTFLLTFAAEQTLEKVMAVASEQISLAWGFKEDLLELREALRYAKGILNDINTTKLHYNPVKDWVEKLQHLIYQADDLLDEIVYEDLRREVQTEKMKMVCNFISPSNNTFMFRSKMAKKMKSVKNLLQKHYSIEIGPLQLVCNRSVESESSNVISQSRETISELDDYEEVVGRDVEVESIVKQVIEDGSKEQEAISILPIVGMGGLGKTTLAKMVFNHQMIKQHFDKTIWVCVSEPFNVNKILGAILQSVTCTTSKGGDNKQVLLGELQNEMHGKRYFLVLDDVWNENEILWAELKKCLIKITRKSKSSVVVTTRSADAAKIMETLPSHHLCKLSDNHCWSLFKESASAYGLPMTSSLEVIRKELVKKIGGVPLVARVLGRAVKFEGGDERQMKMLESIVRSTFQDENFTLSILKLSVDRLPFSSLKQCFAYCSNFPKDFVFQKEQLVQMWMAQGFIQAQGGRIDVRTKNVGDEYFSILLSRCLFQDAKKDSEGRIISCKMHDLIHDIACEVSSDGNLELNSSNLLENVSKVRTMISYEETLPKEKMKLVDDKITKFLPLRVLIVNSWSIYKLSNSVGKLKHLRYLEISDPEIVELPPSIVLLYNLQTLRIANSMIRDLPKNLRELVSLRHLDFSMKNLVAKKMPPHLSRLTQLQTLPIFVVAVEKGCDIAELGPLPNLKDSLQLFCLEKVQSKEKANEGSLEGKEHLDGLAFNWSKQRNTATCCSDLEVLEGLQPPKNLGSLKIHNFAGKCLPNKIFVENLRAIGLWDCKNCERFPMLGQLNNLKELEIYGLDSVQSIGKEFYGNYESNQRTFFSKLERFILKGMINLEHWEEITTHDDYASSNVTTFPHLKELKIHGCPKLSNIPNVFGSCDENEEEHLELLSISHCDQLMKLPNGLQFCHSIKLMEIDHNGSYLSLNFQTKPKLVHLSIGPLEKLPEELGHLMKLQSVKIVGCIQNYDFSPLMQLPSLKELCLVEDLRGNKATQLPQQLQHLTALKFLSLQRFNAIETLPEWLGNFVSLHTLSVSNCENLKRLPSREAMLRLTKLSHLYVIHCPKIQLGTEGDMEMAKLSHLPNIKFYLDCNCSLSYSLLLT